MKLAPSKNPEKESKQFAIGALVSGIVSLVIWPAGIAALGFGVRGAILSKRVNSNKHLFFSVLGIMLGLFAVVYYYSTKS